MVVEVLGFTNISTSSCSLTGYPGVAGLDAQGTEMVQAKRVGEPGPSVTLAPHQVASAMVNGEANSASSAPCPAYRTFLVTPPDLTQPTAVRVALNLPYEQFRTCTGLTVEPVVAGSTGEAP